MNYYKYILPIGLLLSIIIITGCANGTGNVSGGLYINSTALAESNAKEFYMESFTSFGNGFNRSFANRAQQFNRTEMDFANRTFNRSTNRTLGNRAFSNQFSLKEITVKRGDFVRIKVNVTRGTHDFNIDELDVHSGTPTGQITTVEFTANKSGDFVYYCSMPGHRESGQWGILKVLDGGGQ